ncbi:collagen alpha-1(III) chain-like [Eublepharis macularius]|uniref:Collagen alpha-1(III) chain-like n=1 Tax=Eublepharis macularius TaxID=481883 RepID=A0AA97JA43_EUBMA|nr:collagen alpha-1(III) chain-like [Eublepharis macularius]
MSCGGQGRWPLLGMTSLVLVLFLHLPGVASRCIDMALEQDLQPLPPGVQRCSLPRGLLQPDVSPPGQPTGSREAGDSRVVGGSPAVSGGPGGGSSAYPPNTQGGNPFPAGRPDKPWPFGTPGKPAFGGVSGQYGRPAGPGQYGGSVNYGRPDRPGQYDGQHGEGPYGHPRVEMKPPGIPYIPTPREWGGGRIPAEKFNPGYANNPNAPYGGGAGGQYPPSYGGGSGISGPRGRYDGSYGPVPYGIQPGEQTGKDSSDPCTPEC